MTTVTRVAFTPDSSMPASLRSRRPARSDETSNRRRDRKRHASPTSEKESREALSKRSLLCFFATIWAVGLVLEYRRTIRAKKKPVHIPLSSSSQRNDFPLTSEENAKLEVEEGTHTRYHVIFSTDCSPYQHWQSYLVYYSAMMVRQPGHVTRIASGCTEEETINIKEWFQEHVQHMSSRFHLHLTPHFSDVKNADGKMVGDYKFFNKPFGLKHWLENFEHLDLQENDDDVVILIDPDMVLLRPLVADFSDSRETLIGDRRQSHILGTRVQHGLPFAQTYGLGTQWRTFDIDKIAGSDSPAKLVSKEDGALYYPVGPPYLATVRDMYQIAQKWTEFAPGVHSEYPHLLAEMYAFCLAAAHLGLRHQIVDSLMISNTNAGGEGWPLIDKIPGAQMCEYARHPNHSQYAVPSVLHMCQRYAVGDDWFFGKRKVPHDLYGCEQPLLQEPPPNLGILYDYKRPPNQKDPTPLTKQRAARETFMVCFLTSLVNDAASFYKQTACPLGTANLQKSLKLADLFTPQQRQAVA